ncbi:MAG TPA: malectin domain-containing carbohydrate-binding protein [Chitinophagales bacterium]|nr:malectin domain-containing carbohydrate-binding protein [Chitinophagales bacterium]
MKDIFFFSTAILLSALCFGQCVKDEDCHDGNPCTIDLCDEVVCINFSSGLSATVQGTNPAACGACDGTAAVNATGGVLPYSYSWSTGETTQSIGTAGTGTTKCINAGGGPYTASNGDNFLTDQDFSGGTSFTNAIPIANTTDDVLYQSERYVGNSGFFSYNIPVVNGDYTVQLHFAEIFFGTPGHAGGAGSRLFDVSMEGMLVLDDYDIFADAGGAAIAVIKSFNVPVNDGVLNILFDGVVNNAKVNAICVKPRQSEGLCEGIYHVTVTDASGCQAFASSTLAEPSCDDGNPCTDDDCVDNQCVFTPINCNDNDACTFDECVNGACSHTVIPGCNDPCEVLNCNDNDLCTNDACVNGNCINIPVRCDDNDACTDDKCEGGDCVYEPLDCDDANACTQDACDNGTCSNIPIICNDNDACTNDFCAGGSCVFLPVVCDDNDACTDDACMNGGCSYVPKNCLDSNPCTNDACILGVCKHFPVPGCVNPCNVTAELGNEVTVYRGYPPLSCANLSPAVTGETRPLTYAWSNGETGATLKACPAVTTTYCVTVTDALGCVATDCITICVWDIRCRIGRGKGGVEICHRTQSGRAVTLCVSASSVAAHLAHGDQLGACGILNPCLEVAEKMTMEDEVIINGNSINLQAYPNPFSEVLNIEFSLMEDARATLEIYSVTGQRLAVAFDGKVAAGELKVITYLPSVITHGLIIYRLQTQHETYYGKAVMSR